MRCHICGTRRATRIGVDAPDDLAVVEHRMLGEYGVRPDVTSYVPICAGCDDGAWDEVVHIATGEPCVKPTCSRSSSTPPVPAAGTSPTSGRRAA